MNFKRVIRLEIFRALILSNLATASVCSNLAVSSNLESFSHLIPPWSVFSIDEMVSHLLGEYSPTSCQYNIHVFPGFPIKISKTGNKFQKWL